MIIVQFPLNHIILDSERSDEHIDFTMT